MHIPRLDEKDLVLFSAAPPLWGINMGQRKLGRETWMREMDEDKAQTQT